MKLYLDEDLSARVAKALRKLGYDVVSSHEVGNDGLPDEAQLSYAVSPRFWSWWRAAIPGARLEHRYGR
ncbi:MAG: DUF5615 family PIN-like protein [candidate division NC10 bacterium]|nr:DUF5615 family PIN-like protein [candidate division NC10 bacterium]